MLDYWTYPPPPVIKHHLDYLSLEDYVKYHNLWSSKDLFKREGFVGEWWVEKMASYFDPPECRREVTLCRLALPEEVHYDLKPFYEHPVMRVHEIELERSLSMKNYFTLRVNDELWVLTFENQVRGDTLLVRIASFVDALECVKYVNAKNEEGSKT